MIVWLKIFDWKWLKILFSFPVKGLSYVLVLIKYLPISSYFQFFLVSAADLALFLAKRVRRRRRGKRAGGFGTPTETRRASNLGFSSLTFAHSVTKRTNWSCWWEKTGTSSSVLCFTDTWLSESIPDCAVHLEGFQLWVRFFINNAWCSDVTVISKPCSPALEYLFINCKLFYSPREFNSFILAIHPFHQSANVQEAQRALADQVLSVERTFPDSSFIILGDFNKVNLSHELPKYRQFVKCTTREQNTTVSRGPRCPVLFRSRHGSPDPHVQTEADALQTWSEDY